MVAQPGVARVWAARLVHALARMALASGPPGGLVLGEGQRVTAVEPLGELLEPAQERAVAERLARAAAEAAARTRGGRGRQGSAGGAAPGGEGVANNIVAVPQGALQVRAGGVRDEPELSSASARRFRLVRISALSMRGQQHQLPSYNTADQLCTELV